MAKNLLDNAFYAVKTITKTELSNQKNGFVRILKLIN